MIMGLLVGKFFPVNKNLNLNFARVGGFHMQGGGP